MTPEQLEAHRVRFEQQSGEPETMKGQRRGDGYANHYDTRTWQAYQCGIADADRAQRAAPVAQLSELPKLAFDESHIDYIDRYGGFCRDCADEDGVCPSSGLPCGGSKKAIRHVLTALAYGVNHGYIPVILCAAPQPVEVQRISETWQPMSTAPKNGTLVRLLVNFEDHATEDGEGPHPTIGSNTWDNHPDFDEWLFAGWCWTHDCYTQGVGTPVGWLPMLTKTD